MPVSVSRIQLLFTCAFLRDGGTERVYSEVNAKSAVSKYSALESLITEGPHCRV